MKRPQLIILGGGPAGLAAAFYAHRRGKSFLLIEKNKVLGGNALTFTKGPFRYDSGAHRWHNVYPEITQDILEILPNSLKKISVPSSIRFKEKQILFPISPLNLFLKLSFKDLALMFWSYVRRKKIFHPPGSFASHIQEKYGEKISNAFLWNYSEKLWGESPRLLSNEISGKRLKGINASAFIKKDAEHLDGSFYYPDQGIGEIFQTITQLLPERSYLLNSHIKEIVITNNKITTIKYDDEILDCGDSLVINTLSPSVFSKLTSKKFDSKIEQMSFRGLVLIFLEINRKQVSPYASIYFPDSKSPITRVVEPKNRSSLMSPEGMTSLALEWPCNEDEGFWKDSTEEILDQAKQWVQKNFSISKEEILSGEVKKLPFAYPLLRIDSIKQRDQYLQECKLIQNLHLLGRNARFSYLHLHDIFLEAKIVAGKENFF